MPDVIDLKQQVARAAKREEDLLRPDFPPDLVHFDDGTWECSSDSLDALSRSFHRYGIQLHANAPFLKLYEDFTFIVSASSLMLYLGQKWLTEEQPPEMLAYLTAVKHNDADAIAPTVANLLAKKTLPATPDAPAPPPSRRPTLTLVS